VRLTLLAALVLALGLPAGAQVQQASLQGRVTDSGGSPLPGVTVTLRDATTNQSRVGNTDGSGEFRLGKVTPGIYELRLELSGFNTYEQKELRLAVGRTAHLAILLWAASVAETVEVTAQGSALNTSGTSPSTVIDNERIEELPVRSRNYLEFVLLAPGVLSTRQGGLTGAARSGLSDSGFSFAGLRPRSNTLTIDGLDNNDAYSGSSRTELSLETISEFEVLSHSWSAENGGGSGGSINVVTKRGANIIHGDAFVFGQSGSLNSRAPLENTGGVKPELSRYRAGFAMGGPLVRDRTFFYVAAEREQTRGQAASDIDPQAVDAINEALDARDTSRRGVPHLTKGLFPTGLKETEVSARIDHQLTLQQSLVARIASTQNRESNDAFNTGGLTDFSSRGTNATSDLAATGSWMAIVGDRATNELRGQLASRRVILRTADTAGPGIVIPGLADFGRPYAGNDDHRQKYTEIGDTFGFGSGHHYWKIGTEVISAHLTGRDTDGYGGLFVFRSLADFESQRPDSFRQTFGDPAVDMRSTRYGVFAQDDWTPLPALTVVAGLRLDGEVLPARLGVSSRQLSPRLGMAWTPSPNWVIRGGAGAFADRIPLAALERALTVDGTRGFEQIVEGPAAASLFTDSAGGVNASPLPGIRPSIYTLRRGEWNSSSRQASIGLERLLTPDTTISASYLFARGHHLLRTVNTNLLPPVILTAENAADLGVPNPTPQQLGRPVFGPGRIDPTRADIFELQPTASSTYYGVTLAVNRRLTKEVEWSIAYTLSKATDDASDFDEQPQNPYALSEESGPSRYDQRHRLTASALFELGDTDDLEAKGSPRSRWAEVFSNIEVAPILNVDSGRPLNAVTGLDDNRSHAWPTTSRPQGTGRNSVRLPYSATLNVRVLKYFPVQPHGKLDLVIEAFNLLNSRNVTGTNTVWGESVSADISFGREIEALPGRQIELSLDFEF
jgi:hypothetical protein